MKRKGEKIPDNWVWCPDCGRPYGFLRCRVTFKNPTRDMCLSCAIKKERDTIKLVLVEKQDMSLMDMGGAPGASGSPKPASVGSTPTLPAGMLF